MTGPYSIELTDEIIGISTATGPVSVILPEISLLGTPNNHKKYYIVDEGGNASINNIEILPTSSDTIINNSTGYFINGNNNALSLYSNGTSNWVIF